MIYDTLIARSVDGLLLCEVAHTEKQQIDVETKRKFKLFLRKGMAQTDTEYQRVDCDQNNIKCLYKTVDGLTFIVFFDAALTLKLACCFLDEIKIGFEEEMKHKYGTSNVNYRSKIETIENSDSYCFQSFERFIKKKKQDFADQNSTKNMERLKVEISELHNIMQENIKLLVDRDQGLQAMNFKAKQLKEDSKMFKDKSADLVWSLWLKKNAIWFILIAFAVIFVFFKFY